MIKGLGLHDWEIAGIIFFMNYVWYHLKNNPKFWIKVVVIPAVLVLVVLDFLTNMFRPPGIFNLWFFKSVLLLSIMGIIIYGVYLYVSPKREKKIRSDQFEFEQKREMELRKIL
jgi:amino acid transporter